MAAKDVADWGGFIGGNGSGGASLPQFRAELSNIATVPARDDLSDREGF
jgi:hypothetical protein